MAFSSIVKRLEALEDIPIIPETLNRILNEIENDKSSAKELGEIIREDPVLTAQLLKIANSPYYGRARQISSVSKAIVLIGFKEVRNIVIGLSLTSAFPSNIVINNIKLKDLWLHSIGTAVASQMIAQKMSGLDPDELFTAGLVHDIGCAVMFCCFEKELRDIVTYMETKNVSFLEAESSLGFYHTEIGAFLGAKWGFSDMLINIIRAHHNPNLAGPYDKVASIVFLADALAQKIGLGWLLDISPKKILIPKKLQLHGEIVKQIALALKKKKKEIVDSWGELLITN